MNGVHMFAYNSAGSELIWMKFGALWVYCLPQALADFRNDLRRSNSEAKFCLFGLLSNVRFLRLPIGQISQNLHTRHGSVMCWILSEQNFENLSVRGLFSKKANFERKSSTTCDFRLRYLRNDYKSQKLTTNYPAYGMLTFHFYSAPQCSHCKQALYSLRQFRLSVRPSIRLSDAGIVSKRRHIAWCSLHCQIAKCV